MALSGICRDSLLVLLLQIVLICSAQVRHMLLLLFLSFMSLEKKRQGSVTGWWRLCCSLWCFISHISMLYNVGGEFDLMWWCLKVTQLLLKSYWILHPGTYSLLIVKYRFLILLCNRECVTRKVRFTHMNFFRLECTFSFSFTWAFF